MQAKFAINIYLIIPMVYNIVFLHTIGMQIRVDVRIITYYYKGGIQKMPITPKEMIRYLKKNGFIKVSQNGSHIKMKNKDSGVMVIVPFHSRELKKGMELAILKQAGLL